MSDTPCSADAKTLHRYCSRKPRAVVVIPTLNTPGRRAREEQQARLGIQSALAWTTGTVEVPAKVLIGELLRKGPRTLTKDALRAGFEPIKAGVLQALGVKPDNALEIFWLHNQEHSQTREVVLSVWF